MLTYMLIYMLICLITSLITISNEKYNNNIYRYNYNYCWYINMQLLYYSVTLVKQDSSLVFLN